MPGHQLHFQAQNWTVVPQSLTQDQTNTQTKWNIVAILLYKKTLCCSLSHSLGVFRQVSGDREVELSKVMDDYQPSALPLFSPGRFTELLTTRHENQSLSPFLSFPISHQHSLRVFIFPSIYPSNYIILSHFFHLLTDLENAFYLCNQSARVTAG